VIALKTRKFLAYFFTAHRWRSLLAITLLGLAGLMEGVGVVTLIPMLEVAAGGDTPTGISRAIIGAVEAVGLEPSVGVLLGVVFGTILVKSALVWLAMTQVGKTMIHVVGQLRLRLLSAMLGARWRYFGTERSGVWANAISNEAVQSGAAFRQACEILAAVFPIGTYVALATLISWQTSLLALVAGSLLLVVLRGFVAITRRVAEQAVVLTKALAGLTVDVVHGLKPIKAMARERLIFPVLKANVRSIDGALVKTIYAQENRRFFQEPSLALLLALAMFGLIRFAALPMASLLVLALMFYRILQRLNRLQLQYQTLVTGEASFWSLMDRIQEAESHREPVAPAPMPIELRRDIRFESVSFAYGDVPVLRALDLVIPAGSFVAILGESGSGKTTLADLVVGLHEPTGGRILVDGQNLADLDLRTWRKRIGYVPQEMLLLNDTIKRNVTLGDESLSDEDVRWALEHAGAWDFVGRTPLGPDSPVGEHGAKLSGGQRQRIAIARALVTRPSLLILDEVTTALDPATEAAICETLGALRGEVTVLSISHQPAMREVADEAYLMQAGRLVSADARAPA
jgi:ATP-binding cassette subfamily C protein